MNQQDIVTAQSVYQKETERKIHKCGTATKLVKGFEAMNNEAVTFSGAAFAAGVAVALYLLL